MTADLIRYVVDGNAFFFTTVDITRRLEFTHTARTIVVGIGYPPVTKYLYSWRRGPDLTPPTPDGQYEYPIGRDGKPRTDLSFGEADQFLDFIRTEVMPHVERDLFGHIELRRKALFGHSYGGIFSLNALYTYPSLFDFYIAASPTIWWSNYALVKNQEADFLRLPPLASPRSLMLTWGDNVQDLIREKDESEEAFGKRKSMAEEKEMRSSARALLGRLAECPNVSKTWSYEFPGEDHGSAAVVALQRGLAKFAVGN